MPASLDKSYPIFTNSLTGYSGGGKRVIAKVERVGSESQWGMRPYALGLVHKHLSEMQRVLDLAYPPGFMPVLGPFYQGMIVSTLLECRLLAHRVGARDLHEVLASHYANEHFVRVMPFGADDLLDEGYLSPFDCNETNRAEVFVFGHDSQALVLVRLDNLGKGASGAAVQNLNLMLDLPENTGLVA